MCDRQGGERALCLTREGSMMGMGHCTAASMAQKWAVTHQHKAKTVQTSAQQAEKKSASKYLCTDLSPSSLVSSARLCLGLVGTYTCMCSVHLPGTLTRKINTVIQLRCGPFLRSIRDDDAPMRSIKCRPAGRTATWSTARNSLLVLPGRISVMSSWVGLASSNSTSVCSIQEAVLRFGNWSHQTCVQFYGLSHNYLNFSQSTTSHFQLKISWGTIKYPLPCPVSTWTWWGAGDREEEQRGWGPGVPVVGQPTGTYSIIPRGFHLPRRAMVSETVSTAFFLFITNVEISTTIVRFYTKSSDNRSEYNI